MLSIIICTNNLARMQEVEKNIKATATTQPEIILYKNEGNKGLCAVYNEAVKSAMGSCLCFMHDDVQLETKGWDQLLLQQLQNDRIGFIGLIGGQYKSAFGVSWNDGGMDTHGYNIINAGGKHLLAKAANGSDEMVCLDGAFLACRKELLQIIRFDEDTFTGFHFYDLDICLQARAAGFKNFISYDFTARHFSEGKKDASFMQSFFLFRRKWQGRLPVSVPLYLPRQLSAYEGYALADTIALMKKNGLPLRKAWQLIAIYFRLYKNYRQGLRLLYFFLLR